MRPPPSGRGRAAAPAGSITRSRVGKMSAEQQTLKPAPGQTVMHACMGSAIQLLHPKLAGSPHARGSACQAFHAGLYRLQSNFRARFELQIQIATSSERDLESSRCTPARRTSDRRRTAQIIIHQEKGCQAVKPTIDQSCSGWITAAGSCVEPGPVQVSECGSLHSNPCGSAPAKPW